MATREVLLFLGVNPGNLSAQLKKLRIVRPAGG